MILLPQKVAYRGTISGLRISSVDGTAFLDACAALVPYADGNHLVEIYDASGRMLRGYLGAAGDGETLGGELITAADDRTFASDTGWWSKTNGWTINDAAAGKAHHAGTVGGGLNKALIATVGALYAVTQTMAMAQAWYCYHTITNNTIYATTGTKYITAMSATIGYNSSYDSVTVDDVSLKQVTAPSADGCTIVSAKGGGTQNFSVKNASFTYNSSAYYVIIRKAR
jgi:hypothetical protein